MSKLTKIIVIIAKNLAESLLRIAQEVSSLDGAPLSQTEFEENPKFASLKIGDFVICNYKKRRIGGDILAISATGEITVCNQAIPKTFTVTINQVVYRRINAYEIE